MRQVIEREIQRIINLLKKEQSKDGSWNYPFETGISTDAYMIILLRTLEINDEELIQSLVKRILSKQEEDGFWKLFKDEESGNISATVEAYYALLYSGQLKETDASLILAKKQIQLLGGIEKSHMFTKIMLALTGQYRWPKYLPIPVEIILLPDSFPINIFDFSVYGRANLIPVLILADKKYRLKTKKSPDLSDLYMSREIEDDDFLNWQRIDEWQSLHSFIVRQIQRIIGIPNKVRSFALKKAENYMLDRIESDGTFLNYFSSTFLMIFALLSLGYSKQHPMILEAIQGLKSMCTQINGHTHMQYTTATVWNTTLISYALKEAGVSTENPTLKKASRFLLSNQHTRYGDWAIHNQMSLPGGWGFSKLNTMNPDIDDSTAALRAIYPLVKKKANYQDAWDKGIRWVYSMQNEDGGWAAFEKNVDKSFLKLLPIQGGEFLLTDPSTPDLTGRTLEFFGNYTKNNNHHSIKKAIRWLLGNQEENGSWYGRWGICYIYGTWAAITGMVAAGVSPNHPSIEKARLWLQEIQNPDGGWGESCKSDIQRTYIPLGTSTVTHTAWAVDTLISCSEKSSPVIESGIKFLIESSRTQDWKSQYPKGQGMAGAFYMHYHSYDYIYPLLALSHYRKKFRTK